VGLQARVLTLAALVLLDAGGKKAGKHAGADGEHPGMGKEHAGGQPSS
jgi:hypothetical protein